MLIHKKDPEGSDLSNLLLFSFNLTAWILIFCSVFGFWLAWNLGSLQYHTGSRSDAILIIIHKDGKNALFPAHASIVTADVYTVFCDVTFINPKAVCCPCKQKIWKHVLGCCCGLTTRMHVILPAKAHLWHLGLCLHISFGPKPCRQSAR